MSVRMSGMSRRLGRLADILLRLLRGSSVRYDTCTAVVVTNPLVDVLAFALMPEVYTGTETTVDSTCMSIFVCKHQQNATLQENGLETQVLNNFCMKHNDARWRQYIIPIF